MTSTIIKWYKYSQSSKKLLVCYKWAIICLSLVTSVHRGGGEREEETKERVYLNFVARTNLFMIWYIVCMCLDMFYIQLFYILYSVGALTVCVCVSCWSSSFGTLFITTFIFFSFIVLSIVCHILLLQFYF